MPDVTLSLLVLLWSAIHAFRCCPCPAPAPGPPAVTLCSGECSQGAGQPLCRCGLQVWLGTTHQPAASVCQARL